MKNKTITIIIIKYWNKDLNVNYLHKMKINFINICLMKKNKKSNNKIKMFAMIFNLIIIIKKFFYHLLLMKERIYKCLMNKMKLKIMIN